MNQVSLIGLLLLASGLILRGYQALSGLMGRSEGAVTMTLSMVVEPEMVAKFPAWMDFLFTSPLWVLLAALGAVMLIIGGIFFKND